MQQPSYDTVIVREAVGVFRDVETLQSALDELELNGFRREELSVLAPHTAVRRKLATANPNVREIMDNPDTPRAVFIPKEIMGEIFGSLVGLPLYIGAGAGGLIAIMQGVSWPFILAGVLAGALLGAFFGGLTSLITSRWWDHHIRRQIASGGLVLWVNIRDPDQESKAWKIMSRNRARYLHVHEIPAG